MTFCSTHEQLTLHRLTHSILSATYSKVSRRGARIAILSRHNFSPTTPYPASIYLQERKTKKWHGSSSECSFGRIVFAARFFARAAISPVQDLCRYWRTYYFLTRNPLEPSQHPCDTCSHLILSRTWAV